MTNEIQNIINLYNNCLKTHNHQNQIVGRVMENKVEGFGSLKTVTLEIYDKAPNAAPVLVKSFVRKGKDDVRNLLIQDLFNYLIENGIQ